MTKPTWKAPAPANDTGASDPDAKSLRHINLILTKSDHKRLRMLSIEKGISLQKLGAAAWNLLLEEEGLEPLDAQSANTKSGRKRV